MSRPDAPIRVGSRVVQVQVRRAVVRTVVAVTADKRTKHRTERRNSVPCIPVIPFYECLYVLLRGINPPFPLRLTPLKAVRKKEPPRRSKTCRKPRSTRPRTTRRRSHRCCSYRRQARLSQLSDIDGNNRTNRLMRFHLFRL